MKAAIYARKSTAHDVGDDAKSVTRQVENATAFAVEHGWTVAFIFTDDGVSGAETTRLHDKRRMLDLVHRKSGPPFDVLVMQSNDRLSRRDGDEAFGELKAIAKAGVEVWFYADRQQFAWGTFETNVTGFLKGEFAAQFRRAIAEKTYETMRRKATSGYVTGGKVFGYDNVPLANGHKDRKRNEAEVAVVREIYERYAAGAGYKQIAHALNAKQVPAPRPQRGRPAGWDPGTVRACLRRKLYRGLVVYGETKKRDVDGTRLSGRAARTGAPITVDRPDLRLIDPDVIAQVDARLEERRHAYLRGAKGRLLGRPTAGRYLLSGLLACECGATFEAVRGRYCCSARRRKGPSVCANDVTIPIDTFEAEFLDEIEGSVLDPGFIDRVVDAAIAHRPDDDRAAWVAERTRLATEIANLTAAIAAGGDIPALAKALAARDRRRTALDAKLARPAPERPDRARLRAALALRGREWRATLRDRRYVQPARVVLQHLVQLPIEIDRVSFGPPPRWATQTRPGGLLVGLIQTGMSPTGFEPVP